MRFLLKTFFCHSLRTGGLALGWIGLVTSAVSFYASYAAVLANSIMGPFVTLNIEVVYYFWLTVSLLTGIVNALLIYGTKKRLQHYMLPWLIWHVLLVTVLGVCLIFSSFYPMNNQVTSWSIRYGITIAATYAPGLALYIYCWLCILSLRNGLARANMNPQHGIPLEEVAKRDYEMGFLLHHQN